MRFSQSYTEEQCTAELAEILETSPRVTKLLQTIFDLSKDSLKRGITCRSCFGTVQEVTQCIMQIDIYIYREGCSTRFFLDIKGRAGYYDGGHKRLVVITEIVCDYNILPSMILYRIVICSDKVQSKEHLEETVVHELVHAFDFARSGRFQSFCHMIACAEVRASSLGIRCICCFRSCSF